MNTWNSTGPTDPGHVARDSDAGKNLPYHSKEEHQDNICQYPSIHRGHKYNTNLSGPGSFQVLLKTVSHVPGFFFGILKPFISILNIITAE